MQLRDLGEFPFLRRLRARMRIAAVVYGAGKESVAISVDPKEIEKILRSSSGVNTIFNLDIQGVETTPAMVADWQHDPVKSNLLHIDLKRIDLTKRLHGKVPVHTTGDPRGVKEQGGLYEVVTREVAIECLPDEIPEQFLVDVSDLMIGQSLRAGELPLSGSMKLLSPPDLVISHVVATRGAEEAAAEAAPGEAAAAEPEVVKKGKKEEEESGEKKK